MPDDGGSPELSPPDPEVVAPPPPPPASRPSRRHLISRRGATAALATGLVVGGVAGGYVISQAATTPSATASPSAGTAPPPHHPGGFGGGGPAARTQDLGQAAGAIGITSAQLQTEISAGKTVSAIAKEHNVDPAKVIATLVSDENSEIDAAVSSGQLTQAQATQMKTQTTQRVTDFVNGTRPAHGPGGPGGGLRAEDEQVVATAVGITTTQLQTELTAGKTIAAIATGHNSTAATVINALVASENSEIDQRISSGQLTAAQGAQMKTMTVQRVTDEVNGTEPAHGGFGGHGGPPGGPAGSPPTG